MKLVVNNALQKAITVYNINCFNFLWGSLSLVKSLHCCSLHTGTSTLRTKSGKVWSEGRIFPAKTPTFPSPFPQKAQHPIQTLFEPKRACATDNNWFLQLPLSVTRLHVLVEEGKSQHTLQNSTFYIHSTFIIMHSRLGTLKLTPIWVTHHICTYKLTGFKSG